MEPIDPEKFKKAKIEAESFYREIGSVKCPYFREEVAFNARGLEHIKFKTIRHARSQRDQYIRFRLISLAPQIIKDSHTLQGVSVRTGLEHIKINSRWDRIMKTATYYEFVAIIKNSRVRVIVKQIEGGKKHFWSIIPFWKMDKITGKRLIHSGKPETD